MFNSKGNMMAESKFTPGDWKVLGARDIPGSKRIASSDLCFAVVSSHLLKPEVIQANAELMADAPRLLEVLRNLLAYAEIPQSWDGIDEAEQAFTQAHEMLEKHCG
jgi:hypothetical protein